MCLTKKKRGVPKGTPRLYERRNAILKKCIVNHPMQMLIQVLVRVRLLLLHGGLYHAGLR